MLGTVIGTLAAWRRGTWIESLLPLTTFLQAMPYFFLATLLLLFFSVELSWFPARAATTSARTRSGSTGPFISDAVYHSILPALTIVGASLAGWIIGMRNRW